MPCGCAAPILENSADPDAGHYVRTGDHGARRDERQVREMVWAYEATFAVAGNDDPANDHAFPLVVVGMAPLHVPGAAVGTNALVALHSIAERGWPTRWLAGDRAYSNQQPENFQLPARALGYQLVFDYKIDQLGVQASHNGALLIEGNWYCPGIPKPLIDATSDYRKGTINKQTWQTRIAARAPFQLRPKAQPDAEGHVRMLCPASDGAPTGRCELKPRSVERTDQRTLRIPVTDAQRTQPPRVCEQQSTTFPPEAGAKFAQELRYASPTHSSLYASLRNAVEGMNGVLKDGGHSALADPSRRRIRGVAAQTLFAALAICATNVRNIGSFLRRARPDEGGTLRMPRKRRRTSRPIQDWTPKVAARSGAPPP